MCGWFSGIDMGVAIEMETNSYATDGKCHNAEPGSFNHECGKPAVWIGTKANGLQSGFCDDCRKRGTEARRMVSWQSLAKAEAEGKHHA